MQELLQDCFAYLDAGVSPFHAVRAAAARLAQAGYARLEEGGAWRLDPGGRYFAVRNGSALIAWRMPRQPAEGWRMAAAHSDNPTFRLKKPFADKWYARAEVEGYGGMRLSTWLDRPLSLAGRVLVRTADGVESRLIAPDRDLLCIPSLCVHFDRAAAAGEPLNPQIDLQPVCGGPGADLGALLAAEAGVCPRGDLLGGDLTLVVRQKAVTLGVGQEFFMSPRIDDLECAWATLTGFLAGVPHPARGDVWCLFDNEEVGSSSRQGAAGSFLPDVLARIEAALDMTPDAVRAARANSLLLSADNGHAVHPNHPEKSDAEHPVVLNGGVVIKYNASQKYTTNALSAALFGEICRRADIPTQDFYNRADIPGGSTLGNLLSHQVSVPMADIGCAQLAMHSAVETAGVQDAGYLARAAGAFYAAVFSQPADGRWVLEP